jgi:hypothetical protein
MAAFLTHQSYLVVLIGCRPPELPIWPHNEYGWSTINPAWLTFSAVVPAETGKTGHSLSPRMPKSIVLIFHVLQVEKHRLTRASSSPRE